MASRIRGQPPRPSQSQSNNNTNNTSNNNSRVIDTTSTSTIIIDPESQQQQQQSHSTINGNVGPESNSNSAGAVASASNRRRGFANRPRTMSNGSTRGAFTTATTDTNTNSTSNSNNNSTNDEPQQQQQQQRRKSKTHTHSSLTNNNNANANAPTTTTPDDRSNTHYGYGYGLRDIGSGSGSDGISIVADDDLARISRRLVETNLDDNDIDNDNQYQYNQYQPKTNMNSPSRRPPKGAPPRAGNNQSRSNSNSPVRYSKRMPSPQNNTQFMFSHHVADADYTEQQQQYGQVYNGRNSGSTYNAMVNANANANDSNSSMMNYSNSSIMAVDGGTSSGRSRDMIHNDAYNEHVAHGQQQHQQQGQGMGQGQVYNQGQGQGQYGSVQDEQRHFANMANSNSHSGYDGGRYGATHYNDNGGGGNYYNSNSNDDDYNNYDDQHQHQPYEMRQSQYMNDPYAEQPIPVPQMNISFPYNQAWFTKLFYNPLQPEFDTLQQMSWALMIGVVMGLFTAVWSESVEYLCEVFWVIVPKVLMQYGVFTDMEGYLPLPHYMWICPAIWGGILAYVTAIYEDNPIPGQNEWIDTLHRIGLMEHTKFFHMIIISTLGMASGLSIGPEMPLVLVAGMVGSYISKHTRQSVLSARVINLTAASAGIGGFFGFPMAGALFCLELPHRMGLQYFEALSPAVFASIIAVIVNKLYTGKDVNGYFNYPFMTNTLPSNIVYTALVYGLFGTLVGILYADGVKGLKTWMHDWFHVPHDDHNDEEHAEEYFDDDGQMHGEGEHARLVQKGGGDYYPNENRMPSRQHFPVAKRVGCWKRFTTFLGHTFGIAHEPTRAAVAGVLAGIFTGIICMLLPHQLFWGEAQLQTLIDRGKTPLPFFELEGETSILTYYGYCMVDPQDARAGIEGFSTACAGILSLTKIITIGLGLGTGICGGHFWGPLYVGCAASHFFTDIMKVLGAQLDNDFLKLTAEFPCVAMICIMACTHIVTYRCHIAIMLILTLTITSFSKQEKEGSTAGDYSAIFPLLVVACFVPMQMARNTKFYAQQRNRGDIVAIPQVLCEPMQYGEVGADDDDGMYDDDYSFDDDDDDLSSGVSMDREEIGHEIVIGSTPGQGPSLSQASPTEGSTPSSIPTDNNSISGSGHYRTKSNASLMDMSLHSTRSNSNNSNITGSIRSRRPSLSRGSSFGNVCVDSAQPSLLDQARDRAATTNTNSRPSTPVPERPSVPAGPRRSHRRQSSNISIRSSQSNMTGIPLDVSKHSTGGGGGSNK